MATGIFPVCGPDLADADNARGLHHDLPFAEANSILEAGGIIIYPTETFWAIGCAADNHDAVSAIFRIKNRDTSKPMPLIAASIIQANNYVDIEAAPSRLTEKFWPGPLTLLLPVKRYLAPELINPQHKVALRISSCVCATELARSSACPIVATSANLSGDKPPAARESINAKLLLACERSGLPWRLMAGGTKAASSALPSTLVEPTRRKGRWELRILREGAIKIDELINNEWMIRQTMPQI